MKLFKKRDTQITSATASPAGSLETTPSIHQSPTPTTTSIPPDHQHGTPIRQPTQNGRDSALQYPWSSRRISNNNPFPRYGHATNAQSGKVRRHQAQDGGIYVFGGLVKDKVLNDLWVVTSNDMQARAIGTTGELPTPRVGHAALLIGNAFIVFGGDTKLNGNNVSPNNDDSLYLLNTTTKIWTVARVAGARPSGRYGHTLNMLGPKVLVFGGQVEGFFFNDLVAFDLNTLNTVSPRWELVTPVDGNDPPPSRTNHIAVTHNDKLYVFGGTNGLEWFNDMWRFDPVTRSWQLLKCSGFVPQPREGHSAALVGDVIYVFGGRDVEGNDLGDLAAFKISSSRWFTFQNMGPGPSARSGHALCSVGKRVYVVGGEGAANRGDEQHAYILDTTKIRFPAETRNKNTDVNEPMANGVREASIEGPPGRRPSVAPPSIRSVSGQITPAPSRLPQSNRPITNEASPPLTSRTSFSSSSQRRSQVAVQRKFSAPESTTVVHSAPKESLDKSVVKRSGSLDSMMEHSDVKPVHNGPQDRKTENRMSRVRSLEQVRAKVSALEEPRADNLISKRPDSHKLAPALRHLDSGLIETQAQVPKSASPARLSNRISFVEEQSAYTTRIAWLEAELQLARKSGYLLSNDTQELGEGLPEADSAVLQALISMRSQVLAIKAEMSTEKTKAEEAIRTAMSEREVALREAAYERAQASALIAAAPERLSTVQLQRNDELETRLVEAANQTRSLERQNFVFQSELLSTRRTREDHDALISRHNQAATEAEQKYADLLGQYNSLRTTLTKAQNDLQESQSQHAQVKANLAERELDGLKLRELEEQHATHVLVYAAVSAATTAATARASAAEVSLDESRQKCSAIQTHLSDLQAKYELLQAEKSRECTLREEIEREVITARSETVTCQEALTSGLEKLLDRQKTYGPHDPKLHETSINNLTQELQHMKSLHASNNVKIDEYVKETELTQQKLQEFEAFRTQHNNDMLALQRRVANLQLELQEAQNTYVTTTEECEKHKAELDESRIKIVGLQQIASARLTRRDSSTEKRRSRNLSSPMSNGRASQTPDAGRLRELEQKLVESATLQREMQASHAKATQEIEALNVRHKESILRQEEAEARARSLEEGVNGRSVSSNSSRDVISPAPGRRESLMRNPNKEVQLAQARATEAEKQLSDSTQNFKERLSQLEADYQSAVHYVKGTEKMLRRMKEELGKYKTANTKLQSQLEERQIGRNESNRKGDLDGDVQAKIADLESQLSVVTTERGAISAELATLRRHMDATVAAHESKISELEAHINLPRTTGEDTTRAKQLEDDLEEAHLATRKLEFENRELERGMQESEAKVKMLLDQFEQSVDTYRRQSMLLEDTNATSVMQVGEEDDILAPPIIGKPRTTSALELLAAELEQMRTNLTANKRHVSTRSLDLGSDTLSDQYLREG